MQVSNVAKIFGRLHESSVCFDVTSSDAHFRDLLTLNAAPGNIFLAHDVNTNRRAVVVFTRIGNICLFDKTDKDYEQIHICCSHTRHPFLDVLVSDCPVSRSELLRIIGKAGDGTDNLGVVIENFVRDQCK